MSDQSPRFRFPLTGWFAIAVVWSAHVALIGTLMLFRAVKHSGISSTFDFSDVPPLRYLDLHFDFVYQIAVACGGVALFAWIPLVYLSGLLVRPQWLGGERPCSREQTSTVFCTACAVLFTLAGVAACWDISANSGFLDWAAIVCLAATTWFLPMTILRSSQSGSAEEEETVALLELPPPRSSRIIRNGMAYMLGCAAFFSYAYQEHQKFFDPAANGGYIYKQFFVGGEAEEEQQQNIIKQFFFGEEKTELVQARLVLYSTSVLFASLASIGGCVVLHLIRRVSHAADPRALMSPGTEARRLVFLLAAAWAIATMVPWQIKLLPEIRAENGWIFPAVTLLFAVAALVPLMYVSLLMMLRDYADLAENDRYSESRPATVLPRRSDFAFLTFLLFPVYPVLRLLRFINAGALYAFFVMAFAPLLAGWVSHLVETGAVFSLDGFRTAFDTGTFQITVIALGVLAAAFAVYSQKRLSRSGSLLTSTLLAGVAAVAALTWFINKVDTLFTFDDWRGMMKSAQFPFLRLVFSLLAAYIVYIVGRCLVLGGLHLAARLHAPKVEGEIGWFVQLSRPLILLLSAANLALATWPFWGWKDVNDNVFARCIEFNHRHDFELRFLHWAFDFDRDGYSAVLHGADPDDFDSNILAGGTGPAVDDNPVPISVYAIADAEKAHKFPNVVVFFLEGVVPRSISAYGKREGLGFPATPHMDAIAGEGTVFTQARCHYPSTWDGWFAVCSGRYLRIKEMDTAVGFGNRYTRYNNLYKMVKLAGVRRWCHADTNPFRDMLVPFSLRGKAATDWKPDYDTAVTAEEEKEGVRRGDKRNARMLKFLDSIEQGEKFFMCEHMSDTHFPWNETPIKLARKLGFPDGLDKYDNDAVLPSGRTDTKYSRYFQTITRMDGQIGDVVKKLKEKGLYDNTMIIIVSDHGCQWWEHEHIYYVSHLYDPAIRIPLIVRYPGIPGGNHSDEPVMQTDIVPTIMELAGLKLTNPSQESPFTCQSLVPLMKGTATESQRMKYWNRDVLLTTHYDKHGVLSQFRHKLIFNRPTGTYRLFDLQEDPKEKTNLVDDRPELLAEMLEKFRVLMKQHGAITGGIKKAPDHDERNKKD